MTDKDLTLIAALLDRSGSMADIAGDMRGGFDTYIANERRQPGTTLVTLAQFDDQYEVVYPRRPISAVPPLELEPRGMTALLDAIGRFITEVGADLAALPEDERPGEVTVVVMTDGYENASTEWTIDAVRRLISRQEADYSWDFVFMGANMDAVEVGQRLGFAPGKSLTYDADGDAVLGAWDAMSGYSDRKRARGTVPLRSVAFSPSEREGSRKRR
ncbi:MAG: VWA domain-containing protein [Mycobacterium sp.]|nr:VWA domain-containing protein [Mycobacterium sp.]